MKNYIFLIALMFIGCTNDSNELISSVSENSLDQNGYTEMCSNSIEKTIEVSPDFIGVSTMKLNMYSDEIANSFQMDLEQFIEAVCKKQISISIKDSYVEDLNQRKCNNDDIVQEVESGVKMIIALKDKAVRLKIDKQLPLGKQNDYVVSFDSKGKRLSFTFHLNVNGMNGQDTENENVLSRSTGKSLPNVSLQYGCISTCKSFMFTSVDFALPGLAVLRGNNPCKIVSPTFVTSSHTFIVKAELQHQYHAGPIKVQLSNCYNYIEEFTFYGPTLMYDGEVPLAHDNGELERLAFTFN